LTSNFNIPTILIAPLDWGLGHATRCVPIIKILSQLNYKVIIAAAGTPKELLQKEFPELIFVELSGYKVDYSKNKIFLPFKIIRQIPKIIAAIKNEHIWLQSIIEEYKIDLVISDNRYGLHSSKIPSIFITHQLTILTPFKWLTHWIQKINYRYINRFTQCWIPDINHEKNIAGVLSHPNKFPSISVHYLGILSRFNNQQSKIKKYDYCILLSGPEPQRTILENKILKEITLLPGNIVMLRGLPNEREQLLPQQKNYTIYNHLPGNEVAEILQKSEFIICRSGYTSVMELLSLQKKSILIPTPAQTEQEFLAQHLMQQGWCYSVTQSKFSLLKSVVDAKLFHYQLPVLSNNNLQQLIPQLVEDLLK
jgi:uncharacterized protein (TIGR00661 family)